MRPLLALLLSFALLATRPASAENVRWETKYQERFETPTPLLKEWEAVVYTDTDSDRYADNGAYFKEKNASFAPPKNAFRSSSRLGQDGWLELQSYSRETSAASDGLAEIVTDPTNPKNHVLRIRSPRHTDATVLRSAGPLPPVYRICARVGYPSFGSSVSEKQNGYLGTERAEPWLDMSSVYENGFYWLAILDSEPSPHNNVYIHHHRKVVIDSDNNDYPDDQIKGGAWSYIWNGKEFLQTGRHMINMFALDRDHRETVYNYDRTGQPFVGYSAGKWNVEAEVQQVRAVDAYLDNKWYEVCIARTTETYTLKIEGDFQYGGKQNYEASLPVAKVFHADGFPDYFMLGDPHVNFYRGEMYVDDVRLEVPAK